MKQILVCVFVLFGILSGAIPARANSQVHFSRADFTRGNPPFTATITATTPGRCPVPVLWWTRLEQMMLPKKCKLQKSEQAVLRITPTLDKTQPMALYIEWQSRNQDAILFRCTGPMTWNYETDNLRDHYFRYTTKPRVDLQAINLYVTVNGWTELNREATAVCINQP